MTVTCTKFRWPRSRAVDRPVVADWYGPVKSDLPAWYLLQGFGNNGLWAAFILFFASRGIGMHIGYRRRLLPSVGGAE